MITLHKIDHCVKCKSQILDKYCLQTKDGIYHMQCLRCHHCNLELDGQAFCYNRNGDIYCKIDYERLFNQSSCIKCGVCIKFGQFIQRIDSTKIFHLDCFKCSICDLPLEPGQRFAFLHQTSELLCELHFNSESSKCVYFI